MRHWEVSWTTLQPLSDDEVERSVAAIARLGCSLPSFAVDTHGDRYVVVRHKTNDELLLEFGFADASPCCTPVRETAGRGLVDGGQIAWNWCCTGKSQPETGLIINKFRQVQSILDDKMLVWDDDGVSHWSFGSCPLEQTGLDPMAILDAHLKGADLPAWLPKAS